MWAYRLSAPHTFALLDVARPSTTALAPGQVLLRVLAGGICGSDIPIFNGRVVPLPTADVDGELPTVPVGAPMHEVAGEVVASADASLAVGALAVGWATLFNGLSEYIVVEGHDLHAFSDHISPSMAVMLQPLACVINAVDALTDIAGSRVAVIGQGSIGVLFSHVLKTRGAAHVTGVDRIDRSDVGSTYGNDEVIRESSDRWAATVGLERERFAIVVEAVGHQVSTLSDAVSVMADGAQIYYFGIPDDPIYPFPLHTFLRRNGRFYSGFTPVAVRRTCLMRAEQHVAMFPEIVEPFVSHRFPFAEVQRAFTVAATPAPGRLKVVLEGQNGGA